MSASKGIRSSRHSQSPLWVLAASILFVAGLLGVLVYFDLHERLLELLAWVEQQGAWASLLFVLIMAATVIFLLPGIFLTTGAGFVFGVVHGSILVVVGTTLGAAISFLIARYLLGSRAKRFITEHERLGVVNAEMARHGWKVVLLTRLIPFFPSKVANYFFGLTTFRFRGYLVGSFLGFIPFSVHNVYLGSFVGDLAALTQRELGRTPVEWALYGFGFAATVVAVVYFNRLARRALARYADEGGTNDEHQTDREIQ